MRNREQETNNMISSLLQMANDLEQNEQTAERIAFVYPGKSIVWIPRTDVDYAELEKIFVRSVREDAKKLKALLPEAKKQDADDLALFNALISEAKKANDNKVKLEKLTKALSLDPGNTLLKDKVEELTQAEYERFKKTLE
jgi:hypothetical protein